MAEETHPRRRYAVLIDADNVGAKIAERLFDSDGGFGDAAVRRIYGNFADPDLQGWIAVLARHAIEPVQVFAPIKGKNASDIALVIDAMDLLHGGKVDGFCLVSSDSDFTRLAIRLRAGGAAVVGCGWSKTPEAFRRACDHFVEAEDLLPPSPSPRPPPPQHTPYQARRMISEALEATRGEDGWAHLGALGSRLRVLHPGFKVRSYGAKTLRELVEKAGGFETCAAEGNVVHARARDTPSAAV